MFPRNSKDILAKHLVGAFTKDALAVLGVSGIEVVNAMPTELDSVEIRQGFTDIVFELSDGKIFHIEFQSKPESTLYRFHLYDVQLAMKFGRMIRTVVFYIGDIKHASNQHDIGTAQYHVENVYLNQLDGDRTLDTVLNHLETDRWTEQDRIRLAFSLHMQFNRRTKAEAFAQVLDITAHIHNRYEQNYVAAIILGLAGQSITKEQRNHLLEVLKMTDILREFEQETLEKGIRQGKQEGLQEGMQEGLQKGLKEGLTKVAKKLLRKGATTSDVMEITGLSEVEVETVKKQIGHQS